MVIGKAVNIDSECVCWPIFLFIWLGGLVAVFGEIQFRIWKLEKTKQTIIIYFLLLTEGAVALVTP
jgi:hypothetical protein